MSKLPSRVAAFVAPGVLWSIAASPALMAAEVVERVSVDVNGRELRSVSDAPAISAGGRFTAFVSAAAGVTPGATGGKRQIYVRERRSGAIERVSVDDTGRPGNGDSYAPVLSADGRFVVFESLARNLAAGDTNGRSDVLLRDRSTGRTTLISAASDGSVGDDSSGAPRISADGRVIAYDSRAGNLVDADTNGVSDIFVFDRIGGTTERVSVAPDGAEGNGKSTDPDLSGDGQRIAYVSAANNLVADDTDDRQDAFVRDRIAGTTVRADLQADGRPGGAGVSLARISDDGARVAFFAKGSGLAPGSTNRDLYVKTLESGAIEAFATGDLVADGNYRIEVFDLDADGCSVVFPVVPQVAENPPSAFLRDCTDGSFRELGVGAFAPSIDATGRNLAFVSAAGTLVEDDGNGIADVFLLDTGEECAVDAARLVRTVKDNTWTLLSLPCEPPPDAATLADVFDELTADDYNVTWAAFTYDTRDGGAGSYAMATPATRLRAGEGFWFNQRTGAALDVRMPDGSNRVPRDTLSLPCDAREGCWRAALSDDPGSTAFNLLGNPFDRTVAIGGVVTTAATGACASPAGCTFSQAVDPTGGNLFFDTLMRWNDNAARPTYVNLRAGDSLPVWSGFWIKELAGAAGNEPSLNFPYGD